MAEVARVEGCYSAEIQAGSEGGETTGVGLEMSRQVLSIPKGLVTLMFLSIVRLATDAL